MIRRTSPWLLALMVLALVAPRPAAAQEVYGPQPGGAALPSAVAPDLAGLSASLLEAMSGEGGGGGGGELNPVGIIAGAARAMPGSDAHPDGGMSTVISILVLLTIITLVPSIMLMTTCFVRIIVVLGLLKQALGTQQLPPPQVITGLAVFMTLLVMAPTLERIDREALAPYRSGEIRDYGELWDKSKQPLRDFMFDQIDATGNWSSVFMVLNYRGIDTSEPEKLTRADVDMLSLMPAYMLSELKVAFLMGFRVYLPFLVIDMVIASLLISMGMMMLPPVLISLPFKLLLFVLVDGWQLVVGSLMTSFVTGPAPSG